jgi:hypothetical protein
MTALASACDFLDDYLNDGLPKPSLELYAASDREGIRRATLRRAEQKRGVKRTRLGATGPWFMYLPTEHVRASPRKYPIRTSTTRVRPRPTVPFDDGHDYEDADESTRTTGSPWGWIAFAIFVCGLGVVLVRRASFTIGNAGIFLPPLTGGADPHARPAYQTPQPAPRRYETVAPYPGDDAIFGSDAALDETWDIGPAAGPSAYETFAAFPGLFDFAPGQ